MPAPGQTTPLTLASLGREPSALSALDVIMADAVGVEAVKAGSAERGLWRGPAPRMARGSNNLADESKPPVGVANR